MTPKEAIEAIKIAIAEVEWNYPINYAAAFEVAIEALEMRMPKKPLNINSEYNGDYGTCPNCTKSVSDYDEFKICRGCGQALDWSDGERTDHNE